MTLSTEKGPQDMRSRIRDYVEEVIQGTDLFVVDVQVRGQKGSQVIEVYLDADSALHADRLATVSRELGFLLETEDVVSGRYNLNVSSPGAERGLTHPRQYRKHVGRGLRVERRVSEGEKSAAIVGDLLEVDDEAIILSDGSSGSVRISYNEIEAAQVQLPW